MEIYSEGNLRKQKLTKMKNVKVYELFAYLRKCQVVNLDEFRLKCFQSI